MSVSYTAQCVYAEEARLYDVLSPLMNSLPSQLDKCSAAQIIAPLYIFLCNATNVKSRTIKSDVDRNSHVAQFELNPGLLKIC